MNLHILSCSHQGLTWAQEGISIYEKRIKRFAKIQTVPYKRHKLSHKSELSNLQKLDHQAITAKLPSQCYTFVCDANGKQFTSEDFSKLLNNTSLSYPNIAFIIPSIIFINRH